MHNSYIVESIKTKYLNLLDYFLKSIINKTMTKTNKKTNLVPQNGRINESNLLFIISLAQGINMNRTSHKLADNRRKCQIQILPDQSCVYEEIIPGFFFFFYYSFFITFFIFYN